MRMNPPTVNAVAEQPDDTFLSASARLARSRAQLQRLFVADEKGGDGASGAANGSAFPRSAIMKAITRHGGTTGITMLAIALFAARPKFALRLLRYLPISAITKAVVSRFVSAQSAKK